MCTLELSNLVPLEYTVDPIKLIENYSEPVNTLIFVLRSVYFSIESYYVYIDCE